MKVTPYGKGGIQLELDTGDRLKVKPAPGTKISVKKVGSFVVIGAKWAD